MAAVVVVAMANSSNNKATDNTRNRATVNSKDILNSNNTLRALAMTLNSPAMTAEITTTANSKVDNTEGKMPTQEVQEVRVDREALTASVV